MKKQLKNWLCEIFILSLYKYFFEFVYLDRYMRIFNYAYSNYNYEFDVYKWLLSIIIFALFVFVLLFTYKTDSLIYTVFIRFVYTICIIPMLSVYAFFNGIDEINIIYPIIFMAVFVILLKKYASTDREEASRLFKMPRILYIDLIVLVLCATIAVAIWVSSGRPIFFDLSYALEQRLQLRANAMPTIVAYLFAFLGSTIFPYLFAKYLDGKKYAYSIICFACGILLFFVNGMKTWLFLYLFYFGIALVVKLGKDKTFRIYYVFEVMMLLLIIFSVLLYERYRIIDFIAQIARVTVVPNDIGYTFVQFFKKAENPYLFLRESVLRNFFKTPYPGGSDFFVINGANTSVSSARANNGLWGDAYKNFGMIGIILYPFIIAKIYRIIELNGRHMKTTLRLFVLFMILWSSINNSFFTWLLTGGVFVIILFEKIDKSNIEQELYENDSST